MKGRLVGKFLAATMLAAVVPGCTVGGSPTAEPQNSPRSTATALGPLVDPEPLPAVELAAFDGSGTTDLATLRGPLVLNLWASYCGPCEVEMPILAAFHERYGDRVGVVGVDYLDPQPAKARALAERAGVDYPLLTDPQGELSGRAPFPVVRGLPFLAFVDAEGRVTHQEYRALTTEDQLTELVETHLGVTL